MDGALGQLKVKIKWGWIGWIVLSALSLYLVQKFATFPMIVATSSFLLLCTGLLLRGKVNLHAPFMLAGISIDLLLVLALQFQRHAIQTAVAFTLSPLQQAHVGASTMATLLYIPVLILGFKRWKGGNKRAKVRKMHIRLGLAAFIFRALGFFLMFSLLTRQVIHD